MTLPLQPPYAPMEAKRAGRIPAETTSPHAGGVS
jgi:hypothetical protein